jgi:tetratricopeptide (TPR) repeat protein
MGDERIIPAPPLARHREGEILAEVQNAAGLVLWQDVRHLRDWAESAPDVRTKLFNPPSRSVLAKRRDACACAGELIGPLELFASMKSNPPNVSASELGVACEHVVEWALSREHTQTAVEFAEAAALVDPTNPRFSVLAGRLTRNMNEFDRAEVWFKRGIGLAREQDNVVEQFWGHVGYGKLCKELGRIQDARKHLSRASRLAWKEGPPSLAASVQHDICALLMVRGKLSEAAERAQSALLWYPKSHPRLPLFAADVALMLVLGRRYAPAARLLRTVLRTAPQPTARTAILALAARAFAGAGEPEEAAVMRHRALKLLKKHPGMEAVARWHLADAHRLIGEWEAAQAEAHVAFSLAAARNDRETVRMTRILLRLIERRKPAPARGIGGLRDFVVELADRMAHWSPRRVRQPGPWGMNRAA